MSTADQHQSQQEIEMAKPFNKRQADDNLMEVLDKLCSELEDNSDQRIKDSFTKIASFMICRYIDLFVDKNNEVSFLSLFPLGRNC